MIRLLGGLLLELEAMVRDPPSAMTNWSSSSAPTAAVLMVREAAPLLFPTVMAPPSAMVKVPPTLTVMVPRTVNLSSTVTDPPCMTTMLEFWLRSPEMVSFPMTSMLAVAIFPVRTYSLPNPTVTSPVALSVVTTSPETSVIPFPTLTGIPRLELSMTREALSPSSKVPTPSRLTTDSLIISHVTLGEIVILKSVTLASTTMVSLLPSIVTSCPISMLLLPDVVIFSWTSFPLLRYPISWSMS